MGEVVPQDEAREAIRVLVDAADGAAKHGEVYAAYRTLSVALRIALEALYLNRT